MQGQDDNSTAIGKHNANLHIATRSDLKSLKRSNLVLFILIFVLLAVFLVHNFDSIGQDIGRHLKLGEIIWQTKSIPTTNLFSFTESDFPFANHHWLSEVIFYGIFSWFGFTGLIFTKIFFVLLSFSLLFFIFLPRLILEAEKGQTLGVGFWPITISFLLSIFIFISRTEVRPEMFSFAIFSFFLFALFRAKYKGKYKYLWFLPVLQLLWVNLHIYFFIGPFLILAFLIDRLVGKSAVCLLENSRAKSRGSRVGDTADLPRICLIFVLTLAATLINPDWIQGAFLPFNILKEYGYSIVENQTLAFLTPFFGFNLFIFVFKLSVAILAISFLLTIKKARQRIFEILISIFFVYAGFRMLRNLPLYALASFPVLAFLLTDIQNFIEDKWSGGKKRLSLAFKTLASAFLIFMIFFVVNNSFYDRLRLSRVFGFSVPNGLERAVNFVKDNKIKGPMFNNFDIGGYLIWRLYPQEKVFVDNRPEAYSVKFFSETYKPMQEEKEKWVEFSEKYGINFIFFAHTDATPWGQAFLENIIKDPNWQTVYVNENAIILIKNNKANSDIISKFSVTDGNAIDKATDYVKDSNENGVDLNLVLSRFFYTIKWRQAAIHFAEEVIKLDPKNQRAYLYKGLVYAYYTDEQNQQLAAESLEKAINSGLKESQYYTILGIVYMNLSRFSEARDLFTRALELDKNNAQAGKFLDEFFNKPILR